MEKIEKNISYIVNMDYEYSLFSNTNKFKGKSLTEFEYIFFFIEDGSKVLCSSKDYHENYLLLLKSYHIEIPNIIKKKSTYTETWWGSLSKETLHLERKLNSKLESYKIAKLLKLCPDDVGIVNNLKSIESYINEHAQYQNFIIKDNYNFSGMGNKIIQKPIPISEEKVIAPYFNRILDIGVTFDMKNESYCIIVNFISAKCGFFGGMYVGTAKKLGARYSFVNSSVLEQKIQEIMSYFKSLHIATAIEVDMFYYKEVDEIKTYYMVEINYRRTMGQMVIALHERWPDEYSLWLIHPRSKVEKKVMLDDRMKVISPENSFFRTIYLHVQTKEKMEELLNLYESSLSCSSKINLS